MTLAKLVPALALLLLAATPVLAEDVPATSILQQEAPEAFTAASAEPLARGEAQVEAELPAEVASLLPVELELMGLEPPLLGSGSWGLGYCYNDCSPCEGLGPLNPACTSPEYPGVRFPCTAIPLC
ncbi:MAG: hypothetical protein MI919_20230 [Holophagales bacterium]|nr:hypothetical protein [Holophagales bacterium]